MNDLIKELEDLKYNAGGGHPFARQMMDRVAEIEKILYPKSDPIVEEAIESGQVIDISFEELFGGV